MRNRRLSYTWHFLFLCLALPWWQSAKYWCSADQREETGSGTGSQVKICELMMSFAWCIYQWLNYSWSILQYMNTMKTSLFDLIVIIFQVSRLRIFSRLMFLNIFEFCLKMRVCLITWCCQVEELSNEVVHKEEDQERKQKGESLNGSSPQRCKIKRFQFMWSVCIARRVESLWWM